MRALVFSDIHNKIEPIRVLRQKEKNDFDIVLIAGDIGEKIAKEFFQILDTFLCPVFCVYGNWDNELDYVVKLSERCVLVHNQVYECEGYFVTGFSGCPTHWGKNPIYLEENKQLLERHGNVLSALTDLESAASRNSEEIESEYRRRLFKLNDRTGDRRKKTYRQKMEKLEDWKDREIANTRKHINQLKNNAEFTNYLNDAEESHRRTLALNRAELVALAKRSGVEQTRLVVMAHERLYRLADDGLIPLLHLFGHVHEYKHTTFKGTHYLNAAAIDTSHIEFFDGRQPRPNGYCRVVFSRSSVEVERCVLYDVSGSTLAVDSSHPY